MKSKRKYRSGFEARVAENEPDALHEPSEPKLYYSLRKRYIPDFVLPNGVIVETKGYFESKDRTKMLAVRKQNPGYDIRFLFQNCNVRLTKSPNSKTYADWADQHGFIWAHGTSIPKEWYD